MKLSKLHSVLARLKLTPIALLLTAMLTVGCSDSEGPIQSQTDSTSRSKASTELEKADQNKAFDQFKARFLEALWQVYPTYGLYVGYYQYDDQLAVENSEQLAREVAFENEIIARLNAFDLSKLSATNATDLELIKNQLLSSQWYREQLKPQQWDPSRYNVADAFSLILNTDYKPLEERLQTISERLKMVPAYYQAAVSNITKPTLPHTEIAIQQNKGAISVFTQDIPASVAQSNLEPSQKANIETQLNAAVKAINGYVSWLEVKSENIADGGARDFRIGEALYEQKFKYDIVSNYTAKQLYQKAIESKQALHAHMIELTNQLWPKYFAGTAMPKAPLQAVKQMIDHLASKHVKREDFVKEVKRQMPIIEKFIIDHDLLDMDASRPLIIRETPEYQRGFSVASVQSPGPYDATANTYYNVSPLDDYSEAQAESHLREYNHWILQVLNIHEAMPGHYTQLMHANKSPSMIKSIFGNGAMIEGWAVYSERMMLESGYSGDNSNGPSPEMWLMYSKWNLRVVVNTILDYSIQVLGMEREQALELLQNEAFQEKTEAEGKWRRATLSQVQLTSYYNGYSEIYAFREELKQKLGDQFNLKDFHNQFLSYGSAPVPVIRQLMLAEMGL